jgi:hypothetical protein
VERVKLRRGTFNWLPAAFYCSGTSIDYQVIKNKKWWSETRGLATSKNSSDSGQKLNWGEWLWHVIVSPCIQTSHLVPHGALCREHNDWNSTLFSELMQDAKAVTVRQHHIKNDKDQTAFRETLTPFLCCVCKIELEALWPEVFRQHLTHINIVIDQQDASGRPRRLSS